MTMTEPGPRTHEDLDAIRRREVVLLGEILGHVLRGAGKDEVADRLDQLRADPRSEGGIAEVVDPADAELVARALTVHLHLVNLADERHRARLLQHPLGSGNAEALWPAVSAAVDEVRVVLVPPADPPRADRAPDRGPSPGGRDGPASHRGAADPLQRPTGGRRRALRGPPTAAGGGRPAVPDLRAARHPAGAAGRGPDHHDRLRRDLVPCCTAPVPGDGGDPGRRRQRVGPHPSARVRALRVLGRG